MSTAALNRVESEESTHSPVIGPPPRSGEWHDLQILDRSRTQRPVVLDASSAAAVCGRSPDTTPLHLYLEKRGEPDTELPEDLQEKAEFEARLTPIILESYSRKTDVPVNGDRPMFFHPDHPWMACTPDGIASCADEEWGVECKSASRHSYDASGEGADAFGEEQTDQVPVDCCLQCQWQMAVMGWDRVDVSVLFDGSKLRIYSVSRNEKIIADLIHCGEEIVKRILNDDPPKPDWSHDTTREALQALYGHDESADVVPLGKDHDAWWWQYRELGQQVNKIESQRTELYNRLLAGFQGSMLAVLPNGQKLTRSVCPESYVTEKDIESLKARLGQVKRKGYERIFGPHKHR